MGQPAFYNTDAIVQELLEAGKILEDARCGGSSGCVETGCFGKEAYVLTGYMNIPKILEITLYNGVDPQTGKKLGLETGDPRDFKTYDELFDAFTKQVHHFIDIKIKGNSIIENIYAKHAPAPLISVIVDDYADDVMKSVFKLYYDSITDRPTATSGKYRINMLPTTCHVYFGEVMNASPNGRLAGIPVSEGISPEKGGDTNGPTAVIKSCAKMDHLKTGGTLLNQRFAPSVVQGEEGLDNMASLIRSYFNMDGHHIQFNVFDRNVLLAAQKNPDDYKDLIVRVAGYSDHFNNLSRALQDEIINRTEQVF